MLSSVVVIIIITFDFLDFIIIIFNFILQKLQSEWVFVAVILLT